MFSKIEKIFKSIEKVFGYLADIITFLLMFILNPGHSFKEVKNRRMNNNENLDIKDENEYGVDPDFFLEISKKNIDAEIERGTTIDEKNKVLLTVAALILAADAAMISIISPKWITIFSAIPTIAALYLILVHFGVRVVPVPNYKNILKNINLKTAKINLGKEYLNCESQYSQSNNYFVGVYRASCRAIILGILLLIPAFAFIGRDSEKNIIKMIKNNSELIELLKGPQGPQGIQGPIGPPGPKGEMGPTGPQGPTGKIICESCDNKLSPKNEKTKEKPAEQRH